MRRTLAFALALVGIGWLLDESRVGCFVRGQHDPHRARTPLGGFRCSRCELAAADLDGFGAPYFGSGYADLNRPMYGRNNGGETERAEPRV